jgi:hypothetical protein
LATSAYPGLSAAWQSGARDAYAAALARTARIMLIVVSAAAAVMAAAAGIGAAYVRAGVKGILVAPRELEEAFQLPVVGTVSWERAWHTRRLPPPAAHKRLSSPITPAQA